MYHEGDDARRRATIFGGAIMNEQQVGYDLDLARMEVNALVILSVECGFNPAEDEVILKFRERTNRQIAKLAKGFRWTAEDVEDAQQEAYCWMKEALRTYDTNEIGKSGGCSFPTFAHLVVARRFLDFAKHGGRVENPYDHSKAVSDGLDVVANDAQVRTSARARHRSDPASIAESNEIIAALGRILGELDDIARRIWELRVTGNMSLHDIAAELAMSYDAVRHRWQAAATHVRVRMAKFA
jgi:RNA polymerase sigma factor (sigma-70 family)